MQIKKYKIINLLLFGLTIVPNFALAQAQQCRNIQCLLYVFQSLLDRAMFILFGFAVIIVLGALMTYVGSSKEDKLKNSKGVILYGAIILATIVSIWGLVNFIRLSVFGDGVTNSGTDQTIDTIYVNPQGLIQ